MEHMTQSYYTVANGKSAIDFIYEYNLGFSYGNAFKYLARASKKPGNSAESDLNKAISYIVTSHNELSFFERLWLQLYNRIKFKKDIHLTDKSLESILVAIIYFNNPNKIAKMIIDYMKLHNIVVHKEFLKYS